MTNWDQRAVINIKPMSTNKAYKIMKNHSTGGSFLGPTPELEQFKTDFALLFKSEADLSDLPRPEPLEIFIRYGFFQQHRSNKFMEQLPNRDVSNPDKAMEDTLEGILWEDDTQIMKKTQEKVSAQKPFIELAWKFRSRDYYLDRGYGEGGEYW